VANGLPADDDAAPEPVEEDLRARLAAVEAKLRLAEQALADTQRIAHVGSWAWHVADGRLEWSPEMHAIFGIDPAAFTGSMDQVMLAIHPDDRAAIEAANREVEAGRPAALEYRVVRPDGTVRIVWGEPGGMTRDEAGNPLVLTGIVSDVTDHVIGRRALAESERRWRFAIDGSRDGLWDWDVPAGLVWFSHRWKEMLGHDDDEVGNSLDEWTSRVHPDDLEQALADVQAHLRGETPYYANEHRVRHRDGSWIWILDRGMVLERAPDGSAQRMIGVHTDITERMAAAEALRASEARYRSLVERSPGIVYSYVNGMGGTYYSPQVESILGYEPGRLVAEPWLWIESIHPDDRAVVDAASEAVLAGRPFAHEYRIRDAQGAWHWIDDRSIAVRNEDGEIRVDGLAIDTTERHDAQLERERLGEALDEARRLESIGRLAGGVAHDFNNMLLAILGNAELALSDLDPEHPAYGELQEIRAAAMRSADLTRQLLAFARKQTVVPRLIDLNLHIAALMAMLRRLIGEEVELAWSPAAGPCPVLIDASQVDQLLANLCLNARDAIDGVGRITIATGHVHVSPGEAARRGIEPGEWTVLTVTDTGSGMDPETLARIFEPFYTTKAVGRGTGLGLPIVHGIVQQNGGRIDVESRVGGGTTFRVSLPSAASDQGGLAAGAATAPSGGCSGTILLVEDEPSILRLAVRQLSGLGYRVIAAASPAEALRLAREASGIDLLLTDVVMPEMNGADLADEIAALQPDARCLFMSGYTADVIARHGVIDEGVRFLAKPFSAAELEAAVRAAMAGARRP